MAFICTYVRPALPLPQLHTPTAIQPSLVRRLYLQAGVTLLTKRKGGRVSSKGAKAAGGASQAIIEVSCVADEYEVHSAALQSEGRGLRLDPPCIWRCLGLKVAHDRPLLMPQGPAMALPSTSPFALLGHGLVPVLHSIAH